MALSLVPAALVLGVSPFSALAAGAALAGFLVLLAGLAALGARLARSPALGMAVAALLGALFAAGFHLGDAFVEWGGDGVSSRAAIEIMHLANPICGAVGGGLGLDWLRLPIMYSGFPETAWGGLSAAQYYDWSYPAWWLTAVLHGSLGVLLLGVARGIRFPRRAGRT